MEGDGDAEKRDAHCHLVTSGRDPGSCQAWPYSGRRVGGDTMQTPITTVGTDIPCWATKGTVFIWGGRSAHPGISLVGECGQSLMRDHMDMGRVPVTGELSLACVCWVPSAHLAPCELS